MRRLALIALSPVLVTVGVVWVAIDVTRRVRAEVLRRRILQALVAEQRASMAAAAKRAREAN